VFRNSKPTTSVRREYQGIQYLWLVHQPITSLPLLYRLSRYRMDGTIRTAPLPTRVLRSLCGKPSTMHTRCWCTALCELWRQQRACYFGDIWTLKAAIH